MGKKIIIFRKGGGVTPFAENSAKIINLILNPSLSYIDTIIFLCSIEQSLEELVESILVVCNVLPNHGEEYCVGMFSVLPLVTVFAQRYILYNGSSTINEELNFNFNFG